MVRLATDLAKTLQQGFNPLVGRVRRHMRRDDVADLRSDSIGGDRSIGTAKVHPAPDQGEGPDEYAEGHLDDSIQRLLLLLQLGSGKGRWRRILLVHGRPAVNKEGV